MAGPDAEIRPATAADAPAIAALYAPYVTDSTASFEQVPPDADEIERRMQSTPRLPWFVAAREGRPVGYCYAARYRARAAYRWAAECSVYLEAAESGRGTARALYGELLAAVTRLGYVQVYAGVTLPNPASVRFHEAAGFTPVGVFRSAGFKHDQWCDVGWWQRSLRDAPAAPPEPQPWDPGAGSR